MIVQKGLLPQVKPSPVLLPRLKPDQQDKFSNLHPLKQLRIKTRISTRRDLKIRLLVNLIKMIVFRK
ncbi:MAG: hypothetical protein CMB97_01790 [Flavobacteriaceae bacterium]|nr:hypothetical protein [Flavobacteriaceae bacterium]